MAFSDIVRGVSPTVVNISTTKTIERDFTFPHLFESPFGDLFEPFRSPRKWKEQSLGSGVIVSPDGYIITNSHVVERADEIKVTLYENRSYKGRVVGSDKKTDIAIIKIDADALPAIRWGDSDRLQVGEFVLAFGNPYGLSHTVTMGIISALGRANVGIADYEDFIQTDAAINPGNSGGPLVNIKGELVGINTAIFSNTGGYQGIGFAVPSNMARAVMTQLIKGGKVTRGWIGVSIQSITPELATEFGLSKPSGVLVTDVFKGSPAERAGLKRGDVILEFDGKEVRDAESFRNRVAQSRVGSDLGLKIKRDDRIIHLDVRIAELTADVATLKTVEPDNRKDTNNSLAGLTVMELTEDISRQLGISPSERGVVVIGVEANSPADEAGIKRGDVIQEMNKKRVSGLEDFNRIASRIDKGDVVLLFINRGGKRFYIPLKALS
ncbi:MAG: DegQ family serine endoprotease [Thermodesulfovibrionia bacterium]